MALPDVVHDRDYDNRDIGELAHVVRDEIEQAQISWRNALRHAMAAGDALIAAQPKVTESGFTWKKWLKENCRVSDRTAQLYQQLARRRPDIETEIEAKGELSLRGARQLISSARHDEGDGSGGKRGEGETENPEIPENPPEPETLIEHWRRCPEQLAGLLDEVGVPGVLEAMSADFGRQLRARLPAAPVARGKSRRPFKKTMNLRAHERGTHSRQ